MSDSEFLSPDVYMIDDEVNETQNKYTPSIAPQGQLKNTEPSSPTTVQSFFRPSNQYLDE